MNEISWLINTPLNRGLAGYLCDLSSLMQSYVRSVPFFAHLSIFILIECRSSRYVPSFLYITDSADVQWYYEIFIFRIIGEKVLSIFIFSTISLADQLSRASAIFCTPRPPLPTLTPVLIKVKQIHLARKRRNQMVNNRSSGPGVWRGGGGEG